MDNLRPIGLMVAAMALFALGDMAIKLATQTIAPAQVLGAIGLFGGLIFAAMTRAQGHKVLTADIWRPAVILRNLSEIVGTGSMVMALSLIELSTVAAILQATPLAVTLGAAIILREHVGWRRWSATLVGFIGVLIILRPGVAGFDANTLWAMLAMLALALRDLFTRLMPPTIPTLRVATYGMASMLPAGLLMLLMGQELQTMDLLVSLYVTLAIVVGVAGYWAITAAMRIGEVSVVAPFRYSRIVFALAVGAVVFGERPDAWMLLGVSITVAAGLYIFMREGRARKPG